MSEPIFFPETCSIGEFIIEPEYNYETKTFVPKITPLPSNKDVAELAIALAMKWYEAFNKKENYDPLDDCNGLGCGPCWCLTCLKCRKESNK